MVDFSKYRGPMRSDLSHNFSNYGLTDIQLNWMRSQGLLVPPDEPEPDTGNDDGTGEEPVEVSVAVSESKHDEAPMTPLMMALLSVW